MQLSSEELKVRLLAALDAVARDPERAPDDHVDLARKVRGFPREVVDSAFAATLADLVVQRKPGEAARSTAFVAAEQFAHYAGADCFGPRSKAQVAALLRDRTATKDPVARLEAVRARAYLHELRRAVGGSTTLAELEAETELREVEPGLWLDLAVWELAPHAYIEQLGMALERRTMEPAAILPRLKTLVRLHGAGIAQMALDTCCLFLHRFGRYEDARSLVARAERIAPVGWTIPCKDPVTGAFRGYRTGDSLLVDFEAEIGKTRYPVDVLQRYRQLAIPLFSWQDDAQLPDTVLKFLEITQRRLEVIEILEIAKNIKIKDQNGRDWFAMIVFPRLLNVKSLAVQKPRARKIAAFDAPKPEPRPKTTEVENLLAHAGFYT
ncbi:MAG: hypothetical protein AB7F36_01730 [Reyranellaceae bacterium]